MIRENPLFMLIKSDVEYRTEDFKTMLATTEAAYDIPGVRDKGKLKMAKKSKILKFGEQERASIFVMHAKALAKNKKDKEARSVMVKAIQEWAGTAEEGAVMLANSEIAIESGDVKKAINILKAVTAAQPTFQ
jgi:tetratricopeptide repeat protein 21B